MVVHQAPFRYKHQENIKRFEGYKLLETQKTLRNYNVIGCVSLQNRVICYDCRGG